MFEWEAAPSEVMVPTEAEIQEEARKVRRLQMVMDLVTSTLQQEDMPVEQASELIAATRQFALNLFPDKGHTFDLIYRPRLQRIFAEKYKVI